MAKVAWGGKHVKLEKRGAGEARTEAAAPRPHPYIPLQLIA